jgi:hypothetical protein
MNFKVTEGIKLFIQTVYKERIVDHQKYFENYILNENARMLQGLYKTNTDKAMDLK